MNAIELADELETLFGNPYGPKRYSIIMDAVALLRLQAEEIKSLKEASEKNE